MPVPNRIERTLDLKHSRDKVWAALTTAEGLGGWFGSNARIDLHVGGEAHVEWEESYQATLWIQTVEPLEKFAYTWAIEGLPKEDPRRTHVEFTLESTDFGTRLIVVETGFSQLPDELLSAYKGNAQGWRDELTELVEYLDALA